MIKTVIFGGTTEGRVLCETCSERAVPVLYCTATEDGVQPVAHLPHVRAQAKRLTADDMSRLLEQCAPSLVFDATHPYATEVSRNVAAACGQTGVPLLRVLRDAADAVGCEFFPDTDNLIEWLAQTDGNIFVTTGSSRAEAFARLPDYRERVWMRILPGMESLRACLDLGYRTNRLICMQGPFSEELNRALFTYADARILVTKNSGGAGGFTEKVRAAQSLGMKIAVLTKPDEPRGVTLDYALERVRSL